jgi:hypothetical protein
MDSPPSVQTDAVELKKMNRLPRHHRAPKPFRGCALFKTGKGGLRTISRDITL